MTKPAASNLHRRKPRFHPRGRQVDEQVLAGLRRLLDENPLRPDRLIEYLHCIQDHHGSLAKPQLAALAAMLKRPMAEVYEVASFYHHFHITEETADEPLITIRVCDSLPCQLAGAVGLLDTLHATAPGGVRIITTSCMGLCDQAPAAAIGRNYLGRDTVPSLLERAGNRDIHPSEPDAQSLWKYLDQGGYSLLRMLPDADDLIELLDQSGLRGLGGAGFPSGSKWRAVRRGPSPRYLCVNADEGEPGTFKDRHLLSTRPHQVLEGMLIAARTIEAERCYIYLRDEYAGIAECLSEEIGRLEDAGIVPPDFIELRRGAGAYICGEESAMIESIEGRRGLPRLRPPYVSERGLFGRPTLVHNVETLFWLPEILRKGPDWFAASGKGDAKGLCHWSVSGRVRQPGVVLAPVGSSAEELIDRCGGMAPGHHLAAFLPGGASGGILPARLSDRPLDFGSLDEFGCFVGSHALIVLSDQDDLKSAVTHLLKFFARESCGQCTPCRKGCEKALQLVQQPAWDEPLLRDLAAVMTDASICGLGQAAPNAFMSLLDLFAEDRS